LTIDEEDVAMTTIAQDVLLNAPPERVWSFVTAPRYWRTWLADVHSVRSITTPNMAAGTRFEVLRVGAHRGEQWIVAEWQPHDHVRFTEYHKNVQLVFDLAAASDSTQLHLTYSAPQRGWLNQLLFTRAQQRALKQSVARLREMVKLNQDIKLLYSIGGE
jgi:uncharacterized protein YndB with AHSA1/START domain